MIEQNEVKLPKEVYDRLKFNERKEFQKKVKIIFDKKQATIRIPTVLVLELGLEKGDCFLISGDKTKIICELVKHPENNREDEAHQCDMSGDQGTTG